MATHTVETIVELESLVELEDSLVELQDRPPLQLAAPLLVCLCGLVGLCGLSCVLCRARRRRRFKHQRVARMPQAGLGRARARWQRARVAEEEDEPEEEASRMATDPSFIVNASLRRLLRSARSNRHQLDRMLQQARLRADAAEVRAIADRVASRARYGSARVLRVLNTPASLGAAGRTEVVDKL